MLKSQMFIAAALFAGVAIGYFAKPERVAPAQGPEEAETVRKIADLGESASVKALRARIAELEKALAERRDGGEDAKPEAVKEASAGRGEGERRGPPSAEEMRERFQKMEKEDPVRFAQMTNHFAKMRERRIERALSKIDFLSSVDTSGMSARAKKTHEDLQDAIARREELLERMHQQDLSDEDRRQAMEAMRENETAMRELNMAERANLLAQTAEALGLGAAEAAEMTATINDIFEATGGGTRMGPPGPPPPGVP